MRLSYHNLIISGNIVACHIGLVNLHHRYVPYMEIRLKVLRRLVKTFYCKYIPDKAWTPDLIKLFADLKICITYSPVLAIFNPSKLICLKTSWSSEGMG